MKWKDEIQIILLLEINSDFKELIFIFIDMTSSY